MRDGREEAMEQPMSCMRVINLTTAQALALPIPASLYFQAIAGIRRATRPGVPSIGYVLQIQASISVADIRGDTN
jgi:hypothetical protein